MGRPYVLLTPGGASSKQASREGPLLKSPHACYFVEAVREGQQEQQWGGGVEVNASAKDTEEKQKCAATGSNPTLAASALKIRFHSRDLFVTSFPQDSLSPGFLASGAEYETSGGDSVAVKQTHPVLHGICYHLTGRACSSSHVCVNSSGSMILFYCVYCVF